MRFIVFSLVVFLLVAANNAYDYDYDIRDGHHAPAYQSSYNPPYLINSALTRRTLTPKKTMINKPVSKIQVEVETHPELQTQKGTLKGNQITVDGKKVWAFLGIPFAKPPIQELRFKKPVPSDNFEGVFDATRLPPPCTQGDINFFDDFEGETPWHTYSNTTEDCLYLNIWLPEDVFNNKDQGLSAVLFWIYGGGFFSGSTGLDIYNGAKFAAQENTIVVTSQYRLGPLGFLYLGTEDAPGNVGLMDQNLALRWVHENIGSFGGDNNRITLFGESAGAASVGYHLLSPASRSFFKRAVMMSGNPGAKYSIVEPSILRERSINLAKDVGCDISQPLENITTCLREADADILEHNQWNSDKLLQFNFVPTIDGAFIPYHPDKMLRQGNAKRTELMISTVKDEGSYFLVYQFLKDIHHIKPSSVSHDRFLGIMKEIFGPAAGFSSLEQNAIINHYTNWINPEDGSANLQKLSEAVGDAFFICPVKKFADIWSSRGLKTFFSHFTQRTEASPWADWMGAMHGDDVQYIFGNPMYSFNSEEKELSRFMMEALLNFAKTGTPSESWKRYSTETPVYVHFNATTPSNHSTPDVFGPRADHCAFWNDLMPQLAKAGSKGRYEKRGSSKTKERSDHYWRHSYHGSNMPSQHGLNQRFITNNNGQPVGPPTLSKTQRLPSQRELNQRFGSNVNEESLEPPRLVSNVHAVKPILSGRTANNDFRVEYDKDKFFDFDNTFKNLPDNHKIDEGHSIDEFL